MMGDGVRSLPATFIVVVPFPISTAHTSPLSSSAALFFFFFFSDKLSFASIGSAVVFVPTTWR